MTFIFCLARSTVFVFICAGDYKARRTYVSGKVKVMKKKMGKRRQNVHDCIDRFERVQCKKHFGLVAVQIFKYATPGTRS